MLYLLECALALEKHGTYHRTAQHLHVSQPTVTRAIQELERLFSVTLFDRTNRGSIPTAFGALLLARNCETTAPVNSTSSQTRWEKASDHAPVWTGQQKIVAIRQDGAISGGTPIRLGRRTRHRRPSLRALPLRQGIA
jgi:hypothetical protein